MTRTATVSQRHLVAALPHLRRYAEVLVGRTSEADNLLADTLERARRQSPSELDGRPWRTQLFGLMHQLYAGQVSSSQGKPAAAPIKPPVAGSLPKRSVELLTQFAELPAEEREVLLFVAVEGMRYEEIAEVLQVSVSTVLARLKRGRDFLRAVDLGLRQNERRQD
jgi:RNA polymerase sigma-70 factor (ECF subfamily)